MKKTHFVGLVLVFSLFIFLPIFGSACNEGEKGHEEMVGSANSKITGMAIGVGGAEKEGSSAHQILEVMLGINSILLNVLMGAGIYWLVKSTKSKS